MLTVVPSAAICDKAFATSLSLQLAALIVCAWAPKEPLNKPLNNRMNESRFIAMVGGTIPCQLFSEQVDIARTK
jgi:hypothetical protein